MNDELVVARASDSDEPVIFTDAVDSNVLAVGDDPGELVKIVEPHLDRHGSKLVAQTFSPREEAPWRGTLIAVTCLDQSYSFESS